MHFKNKTTIILILILILSLFMRLQYIDKPFSRDEPLFIETAGNLAGENTPWFCERCLDEHGKVIENFNYHTPLYIFYLSNVVKLFGFDESMIRFSMIIFSFLTVVLIYFVGKELGGEKLGLLSAFLLAVNRLHIEHSQIIDIDGSFLTFFVLSSIFFLLKWEKTKNRKYTIPLVVTLVLSLFAKEASVLLFPAMFLYLYNKRRREFFEVSTIVFSSTIFLTIIFSVYYSTNFFNGIMQQVNGFVLQKASSPTIDRLYQYAGILTWEFTAPFVILSLISIVYNWKSRNRFYRFLIYTAFFFILFYTAIMGLTRYLVPIVPILCLLSASFLLNKIKTNDIGLSFLLIFIIFTTFYTLGIRTDIAFLKDIKTNLPLISIPYIITLVPLTLYLTRYKKLAIMVLFSMVVGYNLYFAQDAINPIVSPNYHKAVSDAVIFIKEQSIKESIITTPDIGFYSGNQYFIIDKAYYDLRTPSATLNYIKILTRENKAEYIIYKTNSVILTRDVDEYLEKNCEKIGNGFSRNVEVFKAFKCLSD